MYNTYLPRIEQELGLSLKGLRKAKMKIYDFLAPAQTKRMQPILVLCMTLRLVALV